MIFVTIGTQLPFDRMIKTIDEIAPLFPDTEFIAQISKTKYSAKNIHTLDHLTPLDFENFVSKSELIIGHAGVGTILNAAAYQKPLIVFPRLGKLKEHRNDHQVDTCRLMQKQMKLHVAYGKEDIVAYLKSYFEGALEPMKKLPKYSTGQLVDTIRDFISSCKMPFGLSTRMAA